jgi:phosphoribosylformylglycinamidine synthase
VSCVHDCSKGGAAVAVSEMAILGGVGFSIFIDKMPNCCSTIDSLLFSESHSRYIIGTQQPKRVEELLSDIDGLVFSRIGEACNENVAFKTRSKILINTDIGAITRNFRRIEQIMTK